MLEVSGGPDPSARRFKGSKSIQSWLHRVFGLDRAISFTILARGWASVAGLVTVSLIAKLLSPAEQGYYYTFGSLVALQIIFELGFSFVILQMASHERARLTLSGDLLFTGDPVAHARLASVIQKSVRWYSSAAVLLAVFLLAVGSHFFSIHQHGGEAVAWRGAWVVTALAATFTFQIDPILSFMEGCGFVANVARLRFAQAATGSTLAWLALLSHHGLYAPALMISGNALAAVIWLFKKRKMLFALLRHDPGLHQIKWRTEVWPFQWRIAISWLCGYFIFQLFNPVLFAYKGPIAAGQMGMSLSLATALQSIAISWINTKAAPFGAMISRKEYVELDHLFFQAFRQSLMVCVAGAITLWLGVLYLNHAHFHLAHRILDPFSLALLLVATILNVAVFAEALYLRAHKQEKFLLNSILGALLVGASTVFLGRAFGARGMVTGYLLIGLLLGLPLGTYTFLKYRKEWHAI
jgi:hypothetical protein